MSAPRVPADVLALRILIEGGPRARERLRALRGRVEGRIPCPACGSAGGEHGHDDNGGRGADPAYCCRDCGEHFDAEEV